MSSITLQLPEGEAPDITTSRLCTVKQIEDRNPGLKGRVRAILRADLNSPDLQAIRDSIIRIGRSVYIDEPRFILALRTNAGKPPAAPRNPDGRAGKQTSKVRRRALDRAAK